MLIAGSFFPISVVAVTLFVSSACLAATVSKMLKVEAFLCAKSMYNDRLTPSCPEWYTICEGVA